MIGDLYGCSYLCFMPTIEIQHISKSYGKNCVFNDLNFVFDTGIYGISGPNGSGKSTLMKCISGLLRPDTGIISWKLTDTGLENKNLYQYLGFAAPYIQFYSDLSCIENLLLILELLGQARDKNRVEAVLRKVGLHEKKHAWYGKLSSGQQQRLRLAGALIKNPPFLLLDEPGTNLDVNGYELVEKIVQSASRNNTVVIIASNDATELALCEQVFSVK